MAIKYLCDGCGGAVAYDLVQNVTVRIEIRGSVQSNGGQYELCSYCAKQLIQQSSPKTWPRVAEAAK